MLEPSNLLGRAETLLVDRNVLLMVLLLSARATLEVTIQISRIFGISPLAG